MSEPTSKDAIKSRPVLQDAPPAKPGDEAMEASDSGRPWVLGMVAAAMLIVGLVIGSILWGAPKMTPHVEPFLQTFSQGDYAKAYGMVAPEWRSAMPQEDFAQLHTYIHEKLGDYVTMRQIDVFEQQHDLMGTLQVAKFDAQFEKGDVTITATLRQQGEAWQLLDVQYVSDLLLGPAASTDASSTRPQSQPAAQQVPTTQPTGQ